jgi:hypothetical protein
MLYILKKFPRIMWWRPHREYVWVFVIDATLSDLEMPVCPCQAGD